DRLTHIPHLALRERRSRRHLDVGQHPSAREPADLHVGSRVDGEDAGTFLAADASTLLSLAWACGLRTNAAYVIPGSLTSSTYWPRPVMKRGSSRRLIDFPKSRSSATVAMASPHFFPAICSAAHSIAFTMLW